MIKAKLYFDQRRLNKNKEGQFRIVISKNRSSAMISTGITIKPEEWKDGRVIGRKDADTLNVVIEMKKSVTDTALFRWSMTGETIGLTAKEIAQKIEEELNPELGLKRKQQEEQKRIEINSISRFFALFIAHINNNGTRGLYQDTYHKLDSYCQSLNSCFNTVQFDDIDKHWLESFERFCLTTQRQNTASRHLRDIRSVFNAAIDEGITTNYPFRKYKIKKEETIDKSYSSDELRTLFNYDCYDGGQQRAVDIFKLMFCLIGINSIDLANAPEISRGRLNYVRAKTHKPYSIKIEPEALTIINRYKGKNGKLVNITEISPNYKTFFNRMGKALRKVGLQRVSGKKSTGEALLPDICTGSARTSWATIAQEELDIPRDVIAAALGHHTVDVTSTYLRTDWKKKVDAANRKVLDWVLYGKKTP